jgi:glutamate 5-kinase
MEAQTLSEKSTKILRSARRIVVKVGTSTVTTEAGRPCDKQLQSLAHSISSLKGEGRQIVLVSSGAIGLGRAKLGLTKPRLGDLVSRQACAAVGQSLLMNVYENLFARHHLKIAQVLLTEDDFTDRRRYSNLRRTIENSSSLVSFLSLMKTTAFPQRKLIRSTLMVNAFSVTMTVWRL